MERQLRSESIFLICVKVDKMGKLIVIEGLDGSGKGTHTAAVYSRLKEAGVPVRRVTFPDYEHPSSALVKMYLDGSFGSNPGDVNPYAASSFFAVDRFASYKSFWKDDYEKGTLILCDRYTTSNIPYQMPKLPREEWDGFLNWLYDYEYNKLELPKPDAVIYLDVPPEVAQKKMSERYNGDESKKDIHESNLEFQKTCYNAVRYASDRLSWTRIELTENGEMLSVEENQKKVFEALKKSGVIDA